MGRTRDVVREGCFGVFNANEGDREKINNDSCGK
jgi:hypothetical protein